MKRFRLLSIALATMMLGAATSAAHACGEVMYRMGGALRYQAFVTRHPAEILVYSGPTSPHSDTQRAQFHHNLEKAGHKVTVITDEAALTQVLGERSFDVVITLAVDVDTVTRGLAAAARQPTLIPVVEPDARNERELRERFPRTVGIDASLNQFLKSIERSMKARSA